MGLKALGYILLIACPAMAGVLLSGQLREQLARLEGIINLVEHIKYEMCERLSPQNEVFLSFEDKALESCGFLGLLKSCRVTDQRSLLTLALEAFGRPLVYDVTVSDTLCGFASALGSLSREQQAERCDACANRLREIYRQKREKYLKQAKLYRSMGLLAGTVIVLLLI